ncbi:MAG: MMPL family transporter [Bacillota bacterium]
MNRMITGITGFVIRFKWIVIAVWIIVAVLMLAIAPSLSEILKTDNSSFLPADSRTSKASALIKSIYPDTEKITSFVLVASRDKKLTLDDKKYVKSIADYFIKNKSKYNISSVISPYTNDALKEELTSADGMVELVTLRIKGSSISEATGVVLDDVKRILDSNTLIRPDGIQVQVTGDAAIGAEQHKTTKDSMDLVTKITVILLLLILLFIYRTPVAPLLPLFTIGASLLISRGIIGYLTLVGFKVSTFTETFLIAVLFGAGTDYCMLIISRFKEELSHGVPKEKALLNSMPSTSEAIISSGGTVIIGFLFMIFAQFGLFNTTGPSVAIGVAISILAVITLIPALIAVLGKVVFWPMKDFSSHHDDLHTGFWSKLAAFVTKRPVRFLLVSAICFLPLILSSLGIKTSFDAMKDLPAESSSIRGFSIMSKHFSEGELMPVKVTFKTNKNMWDTANLKILDNVAENLLKVDTVNTVRTASRPLGKKLTQTSLGSQIKALSTGIDKLNDGFDPVTKGLENINKSIKKIEEGLKLGSDALGGEIASGINKSANGADESSDALNKLSKGSLSSITGINSISKSLDSLSAATKQTKTGYSLILLSINNSIKSLDKLAASQPALQANIDFQTAYQTLKGVASNFTPLQSGLTQISSGISLASGGLKQVATGLSSVESGVSLTAKGSDELASGLRKIRNGVKLIADNFDSAANGLGKISEGFAPLQKGVSKMNSGLQKIISETSKYTSGGSLSGEFYLPKDVFKKYPEFKEAVSNYISPSGNGATMEVVLNVTPYSTKALDSVKEIENAVRFTIKGTELEKADFAVSGVTPSYNEIREFISRDMIVVIVFVLLGIFLILALLLRSLIAPLYLLLTIVLSYISTLGVTYLIFCVFLGQDGLHWSVQFFSFCVLVALGVDYNIFLMSRVKEEYIPGNMRLTITRALATTGGIITSCGIIMAGTFGAMMISPLRPMVQIGFAACFGLIVDTFIIRSIVVPAIAVLVGEMNWWPGRRIKVESFNRKDPPTE